MLPSQQVLDADGETVVTTLLTVKLCRSALELILGDNDQFYGHPTSLVTIDTGSDSGGAIDWNVTHANAEVLVTLDSRFRIELCRWSLVA
ncbi:MAG: hypothetical protein R3C05_08210 [Pirellulaceae bacterium]